VREREGELGADFTSLLLPRIHSCGGLAQYFISSLSVEYSFTPDLDMLGMIEGDNAEYRNGYQFFYMELPHE
jgi:hypothetical protein